MLAKDLKEKELIRPNDFHVIAFDPGDRKYWWHVHDGEEVPEDWALKPFPNQFPR